MLAVTDFPDIRLKAAIQSADEGNILLIPREGGYLVRLYVDLGEIDPNNREAFREKHTQDKVIATAQRVLHPYTLDVKDVAWFAVYQVGQRVTDRFDDVPAEQAGIAPAAGLHRRRRLPHAQRQGRPGHERVDAGRVQPRLEARLGSGGTRRAGTAAHLLHRAPCHCPGADRLRQGVVEDHGVAAEGPEPPGARRRRSGGAAGVLREVGPLHGRRRDALRADDGADGRSHPSGARHRASRSACASTRRPSCAWPTPSRCSSAMPPARTAPGGSTPLPMRAASGCASSRPSWRSRRTRPFAGSRRGARDIDSVIDVRAVFQQGHRELKVEELPSTAASAQGALRAGRLREGLLPRPQGRARTSSTCAASTANRARWSSSVPTSTWRTCCRWTRTTSSRPSSASSCSIGVCRARPVGRSCQLEPDEHRLNATNRNRVSLTSRAAAAPATRSPS